MKRVLIFGSAGFVGNYLIKEFLNHGYMVIGSDKAESQLAEDNNNFKYISADILEEKMVENIISMETPDYIVNLAAISSVGYSWKVPQLTMDVNVKGTLNILEAVKKIHSSSKILLVGSSEEYLISDKELTEDYPVNANNPYGISKVTQEQFAKLYRDEYGMKIITTRTFNHTGIGQADKFVIPSFVKQVVNIQKSGMNGEIKVGNLSAKRDMGDVRDMTSAYRMILESNTTKHIFNVGSGNCYKLSDILDYIISKANVEIEIKIDKAKLRPLDNPVIWCDNSLIKNEIGWTPKYNIYDAIDSMYESLIMM